MESLADNNKQAVKTYLDNWVDYHPDEQTGIPLSIITDETRGHFLLMENGVNEEGWVSRLFVHFRVNDDGKIILLENNTSEEPLEELMELGVSENDYLVAWREPAEVKSLFSPRAA